MILPAQAIRRIQPVQPFRERTVENGMTYGLGPAGYDVRVAQSMSLRPGEFRLASTVERFKMPADVMGYVKDKSSWARQGLSVFNTVIEPGWEGYLTLEIVNHHDTLGHWIENGSPIAQVVFHRLEEPTELPYVGKYNKQEPGPQPARMEVSE